LKHKSKKEGKTLGSTKKEALMMKRFKNEKGTWATVNTGKEADMQHEEA